MGIAAYNRGSRAISAYITQQLRKNREIAVQPKPPCTHLEVKCSATSYGWNKYRWCADCRKWFWHGDEKRNPENNS